MYCKKCGNELTEIDKFCPKCGNAVDDETTNYSEMENQQNIEQKKSPTILIIGIVILVVIIVLVGIFIYKKQSNNNISSNNQSTQENISNSNTTKKEELTGIEKAIRDKMLNDYISLGITEEELRSAYYDGNLQFYYDSWEQCLKDAKSLNILKDKEEITGIEEAIRDGMLDEKYMRVGITQEEIYSEYYEGNLNKYYRRWETCLTDADKLGILRNNDEI